MPVVYASIRYTPENRPGRRAQRRRRQSCLNRATHSQPPARQPLSLLVSSPASPRVSVTPRHLPAFALPCATAKRSGFPQKQCASRRHFPVESFLCRPRLPLRSTFDMAIFQCSACTGTRQTSNGARPFVFPQRFRTATLNTQALGAVQAPYNKHWRIATCIINDHVARSGLLRSFPLFVRLPADAGNGDRVLSWEKMKALRVLFGMRWPAKIRPDSVISYGSP
jgi:hypothetical protein